MVGTFIIFGNLFQSDLHLCINKYEFKFRVNSVPINQLLRLWGILQIKMDIGNDLLPVSGPVGL